MTAKQSGASCPSCGDIWPAEYAMKDQAPKWKCLACAAGGSLLGAFAGRSQKPQPAPARHKPAPQGILR